MPITVTTRTTPPSTDLYLSGLPAGTVKVWVWRSWSNQQARVRGDDQTKIIGSEARLEDYDFPVNRNVSYYAQCFDNTGAELAGMSITSPVVVNLPNSWSAWLSDPVAPSLAKLVELHGESDQTRTYPQEVTYAHVIGQRAPNAIGGIRSAAADWPFVVIAPDFEAAASIEALIAGGGVLLVRSHPDTVRHSTGLLYLSAPTIVANIRRDMIYPNRNRSDWQINGREVRPPGLAVVAPIRSYQNLRDENSNYQAVVTRYANYLAAARG